MSTSSAKSGCSASFITGYGSKIRTYHGAATTQPPSLISSDLSGSRNFGTIQVPFDSVAARSTPRITSVTHFQHFQQGIPHQSWNGQAMLPQAPFNNVAAFKSPRVLPSTPLLMFQGWTPEAWNAFIWINPRVFEAWNAFLVMNPGVLQAWSAFLAVNPSILEAWNVLLAMNPRVLEAWNAFCVMNLRFLEAWNAFIAMIPQVTEAWNSFLVRNNIISVASNGPEGRTSYNSVYPGFHYEQSSSPWCNRNLNQPDSGHAYNPGNNTNPELEQNGRRGNILHFHGSEPTEGRWAERMYGRKQ